MLTTGSPHPPRRRERSVRAALLNLCTLDFLSDVLPGQVSASSQDVIGLTVRRNIASGRAVRLMQRLQFRDPASFLGHYVGLVARHRQSEWTAWMAAQNPANHGRLYDDLLGFAGPLSRRFERRSDGLCPEEIANEAFVSLIVDQRAYRYPFDVPWSDWLGQFAWLCARRLTERGPSRRVNTISISDLYEESELGLATTCGCGQANCDCVERRLDLRDRLKEVTEPNRYLFNLWVGGYTVEESGEVLHMSGPAVTNRRARIRKLLRRSGQIRPFFDGA